MKKRSPIAVFLLGLVTIGFYSWYWAVKTKTEMNSLGQKIPTAWIWLIPIVGPIWWYWKYSEGVQNVTNKEISTVLAFVVLDLLGGIGQAIIQDSFNKISIAQIASASAPIVDQTPAALTQTQVPAQPVASVTTEPIEQPQNPNITVS